MTEKTQVSKVDEGQVLELALPEDELEALFPEDEDEDGDGEVLQAQFGAVVISALMTRPDFYWKNYNQLTPPVFADAWQRTMVASIEKGYRLHGVAPDPILLKAALAATVSTGTDQDGDAEQFVEDEVNQIMGLREIVADDRQLGILQTEVNDVCKQHAYSMAFAEAQELLAKEKYEDAMRVINKAGSVAPVEDDSLDLFGKTSEIFDLLKKDHEEVCAVSGFPSVDAAKQGGFRRGELIVFVGKPGKGKSAVLGHVAVANVMAGKNVLFLTLENAKATVVTRIIACMMKVPMDQIHLDRINIKQRFMALKKQIEGGLRIEESPGGAVGMEELRGILERLKRIGDFIPDVVILDYLGEMKPDKQNSRYEWLETRAQEIRSLASEYGCAMITAAQTNRKGEETSIVTAYELGDCYGIFRKADMLITLNADEQERARNLMRLYVDKNRQGKSGFIVWLSADFPTMQFQDMDRDRYEEIIRIPLAEFDAQQKKGIAKRAPVVHTWTRVEAAAEEEDRSEDKPKTKQGKKEKKKNPFSNRYTQDELSLMREIAETGGSWETAAEKIRTHSAVSVRLKWESMGLPIDE